MHQQVSVFS